jgi:hypothetical protein
MKKKTKTEEIKPENLVSITREIKSIYEGKRIYCVVADSVQHPLESISAPFRERFPMNVTYKRNAETRSVQQPAGRLAAQAAHVVSKVRHNMLKDEIVRATRAAKGKNEVWYRGHVLHFEPVTTIILAAADSLELHHVRGLLAGAQIKYEVFYDENPDAYGRGVVMTAVATVPVFPDEVYGILDYLPLWKPRDVAFDASKVR